MAATQPDRQAQNLPLATCIALCGMAPLAGLSVSGIAPVMPQITAEFADTPNADVLVRLMMSGLSAATIVGALGAGVMASRLGTARLLQLTLAAFAVTGAGIFLLDNLYLMVAARLLQGVANGGAGVLALALLTTRVQAQRRDAWLGYFSVTGAVGFLLLIMVVGMLANFGWRYAFLIFLLAVPVGLAIALTFREETSVQAAGQGDPQTSRKGLGIPWGMVLFGVLCGGITTTSSMYIPYYLDDIGNGPPETVAMVLMIGGATSALAAFLFGRIRAHLSAIQAFVCAFALIAVGLLAVTATVSMAVIIGGWAAYGLGLGLMMPNLFSACAAATPELDRARMLGFVRSGIYGGPLIIQPGLEAALRWSGAIAAIAGIAALSLLALVMTLTLRGVFDPVE